MTKGAADTTVLAVDGGGTRCRLALFGPNGRHQVEVGPANVFSGFERAVAEIRLGVEALARDANVPADILFDTPAYLGLAGVTDDQVARAVTDALPFSRVRVSDDRRIALRGALGETDGVLAHCGTGSFLAFQAQGRVRFAGGWGWQLGDQASAYWVVRSAMSVTLDSVDGLIPASDLTRALLSRFGSSGAIVDFCGTASPGDIAALAPDICAAAQKGDPVARPIFESGAAYLDTVATSLGWRDGMEFCLTGGIGPHYQDYLPSGLRAALVEPAADPIDGALDLARMLAMETLP
ncbi:MAG: BadF/BadG/BcrA/BcrD ATPase family protein [Pseudomonadota bacterium]